MAECYLALSRDELLEALGVVATASGQRVHLLEKDIWVVWALHARGGDAVVDAGVKSSS